MLVLGGRLGVASRFFIHNRVGNLVGGMDLDVSLLQIERALPVEGRILKATHGGATPEHIFRDLPRYVRARPGLRADAIVSRVRKRVFIEQSGGGYLLKSRDDSDYVRGRCGDFNGDWLQTTALNATGMLPEREAPPSGGGGGDWDYRWPQRGHPRADQRPDREPGRRGGPLGHLGALGAR